MQRINKLILQDFKFYYGKHILPLDGNNALIYGENGSGKSSIYWALYTFIQSSIKNSDDVQKYFDPQNPQNLVNRYAPTPNASIEIELIDDNKVTTKYTISKTVVNTNSHTDTLIKEANLSSDFINYRLLARLYDFRNSENIDLFKLFELEILDYLIFSGKNAGEEWRRLKDGLSPRPNMTTQAYQNFQQDITRFNTSLNQFLGRIVQEANIFLTEDFTEHFKINFSYENATYDDFIPNSTTSRNHITISPKIHITVEFTDPTISNNQINKPHTFLNEAKLTSIALSIRLAIMMERISAADLKILILDDLLISLDMSNRELVLGIILTKFIHNFQLLILTHDKHFFEMARHKIKTLSQDNWKYFEMYQGWKENIPLPFITEGKSYLEKAEKYFFLHEHDIAGNFLRKEAENFCKDFLPKKMQYTADYALLELNGLILKSVEFARVSGLDDQLFIQLDGYRKFVLNPTSHDSYDVPKYKKEIMECLDTLKELRKIHILPFLHKGEILEFDLVTADGVDTYKFEISLEDDFKVYKIDGQDPVISRGMINYWITKNGTYIIGSNTYTDKADATQHDNTTIKKFYDKCYSRSDKSKNANFLNEIVVPSTGIMLKDL